MTAAVLTLGSLHYDIMVETDHLPRRDETAVGRRWYPKFGGKGGNQAVAVAKAGRPSRMAGALGDDDFGRFLRRHLQDRGVDDRFVATLPGAASGMSVAIQDAAGDYAATIVSGANLLTDPACLADPALWDGVALLVLQNEIPEALNRIAAAEARRRGLPVVLNAAPFRPLPADLLACVTHLIVNAVEAEALGAPPVTRLDGAKAAALALARRCPAVIVTCGAQGLAAAFDGKCVTVPAERVQVVSSHGAGDAFAGTLAAALAGGAALTDALQAASKAAAAHVARA